MNINILILRYLIYFWGAWLVHLVEHATLDFRVSLSRHVGCQDYFLKINSLKSLKEFFSLLCVDMWKVSKILMFVRLVQKWMYWMTWETRRFIELPLQDERWKYSMFSVCKWNIWKISHMVFYNSMNSKWAKSQEIHKPALWVTRSQA